MTIAAAYLTSEGVVFGADSTTTVSSPSTTVAQGPVLQVLNHAQKVFEIGPAGQGRLALCTWNAASVGAVSHRTIAARLGEEVLARTTVEDAAIRLKKIVEAEATRQKNQVGDFGYFLGGWQPKTHIPKCFMLQFQKGKLTENTELEVGQGLFQGAPHVFTRVFHGFDPNMMMQLKEGLVEAVKDKVPDFDNVFEGVFSQVRPNFVTVGLRDLPIREAVDLVHSYLHITIKYFKHKFGAPICGGPIELGFVSSDRNFRWVSHKSFDSAIDENEGGRHD